MNRFFCISILMGSLLMTGCQRRHHFVASLEDITSITGAMTELMVHDVTNPPLAARFFAYTYIAGYEVISENDPSMQRLNGMINGYPAIPRPAVSHYNYQLASLFAMLYTAEKLQPSGGQLQKQVQLLTDKCRSHEISEEEISSSESYGLQVSQAILKYAKADGYRNISDYPRYSPRKAEGYWYPTPPGYFPAVEPYFSKVRPFMLPTADCFTPAPPTPFSTRKGSPFFKLMEANYTNSRTLTAEQRAVAAFWDCNPFALQDDGHLMIGLKKISPGAHWLGITGIVCKKNNTPFNKALFIHTIEATTLMDAFICCWDEKYRSNRIRPESAIRKYIDPNWVPMLQTPPFPEYLSGHSVVSAASAEVLTYFFGSNESFLDSVEQRYGLPARRYNSFRTAAREAGVSRFYGGIHFMDAVDEGLKQGEQVGLNTVHKITAGRSINIVLHESNY